MGLKKQASQGLSPGSHSRVQQPGPTPYVLGEFLQLGRKGHDGLETKVPKVSLVPVEGEEHLRAAPGQRAPTRARLSSVPAGDEGPPHSQSMRLGDPAATQVHQEVG